MDFGIRSIDRDQLSQPSGARRSRGTKDGEPEFIVPADADGRRKNSQPREPREAPADDPGAEQRVAPRANDEAGTHLDLTA
jgi:hypothetical protein